MVNREVSGAHYGLRDWLAQRATAVVMLVYTLLFLLAALLWPAYARELAALLGKGLDPAVAQQRASDRVTLHQAQRIALPRRFSTPAREIWDMQLRLPRRSGRRAEALLANPRFRAAYDFLLLREAAGPLQGDPEDIFAEQLGQWWSDYQDADDDSRASLARDAESRRPAGEGTGAKRRRRRRR